MSNNPDDARTEWFFAAADVWEPEDAEPELPVISAVFSQGVSNLRLLGRIRSVGIDVPPEVNAESKLYQDVRLKQTHLQRARSLAASNLLAVSTDEFDAAQAAFSEAVAKERTFTAIQGELLRMSEQRLSGAISRYAYTWEREVVNRFNQVVDEFDLNQAARNLPNLADTQNTTIMRIDREQGEAVQTWRNAVWRLHPLWEAYTHLAVWRGLEAPSVVTAETRSVGILTACRLGDPGSFETADGVTTSLVEAHARTQGVAGWDSLLPFIIPAIHGYPLHLNTNSDATRIRNRIQFGAAA